MSSCLWDWKWVVEDAYFSSFISSHKFMNGSEWPGQHQVTHPGLRLCTQSVFPNSFLLSCVTYFHNSSCQKFSFIIIIIFLSVKKYVAWSSASISITSSSSHSADVCQLIPCSSLRSKCSAELTQALCIPSGALQPSVGARAMGRITCGLQNPGENGAVTVSSWWKILFKLSDKLQCKALFVTAWLD